MDWQKSLVTQTHKYTQLCIIRTQTELGRAALGLNLVEFRFETVIVVVGVFLMEGAEFK